jgi:hypothetical protein
MRARSARFKSVAVGSKRRYTDCDRGYPHSSPRAYPTKVPMPEYPGHYTVKKITTGGTFRFANRVLYLANALTGELVGIDNVADGVWHSFFSTVLIAALDERNLHH